MEREKSIPVQAVVCKIIQCAPLRYSAQHRISSFWKVDFTSPELHPHRLYGARFFNPKAAVLTPYFRTSATTYPLSNTPKHLK